MKSYWGKRLSTLILLVGLSIPGAANDGEIRLGSSIKCEALCGLSSFALMLALASAVVYAARQAAPTETPRPAQN